MNNKYFYKNTDNTEHGPVDAAEISKRIRDGSISFLTKVRLSGYLVWQSIDRIPELAPLFSPVQIDQKTGIENIRISDMTVGDLPQFAWFCIRRILPWAILVVAVSLALQSFYIIILLNFYQEAVLQTLSAGLGIGHFSVWPLQSCNAWIIIVPPVIWFLHWKHRMTFHAFIIAEIGAYVFPITISGIWIYQMGLNFASVWKCFLLGMMRIPTGQ